MNTQCRPVFEWNTEMIKVQFNLRVLILCCIVHTATFVLLSYVIGLLVQTPNISTSLSFFDYDNLFGIYDLLFFALIIGMTFVFVFFMLNVHIDENGLHCKNALSPFQTKRVFLPWDSSVHQMMRVKLLFGCHFSVCRFSVDNKRVLCFIPGIRLISNSDEVLPMITQHDKHCYFLNGNRPSPDDTN